MFVCLCVCVFACLCVCVFVCLCVCVFVCLCGVSVGVPSHASFQCFGVHLWDEWCVMNANESNGEIMNEAK